ncbi:MAG TPA: Ig-like domain-containing protein [Spirochaetia bacterium]|nr:Ig-like domain-containing protein [Spirochaetia bacterium]
MKETCISQCIMVLAVLLAGSCRLIDPSGPVVVRTSPSSDNQILKEGEGIWIEFPDDIERDTAEDLISVQSSTENLLGRVEWDGYRARFIPDEPLTPGRRYIFSCIGEVSFSSGKKGNLQIAIPFFSLLGRTEPFSVQAVSPERGCSIMPDTPVKLSFSAPLDPASIVSGIEWYPGVSCSPSLDDSGRIVTLLPEDGWENFSVLTIRVTEKLLRSDGVPFPRVESIAYSVSTAHDAVAVSRVRPALKSWELGFPSLSDEMSELKSTDALRISFTTAMDREETYDAANISPSLPGKFIWEGESELIFVPDGNFAVGTEYLLEVKSTACSASGRTMDSDYSLRFFSYTPFLELLTLDGLQEDGFPLSPPFDQSNPVPISVGESPHVYSFILNFSSSFTHDAEKLKATQCIELTPLFPAGASFPSLRGTSWPTDRILLLTYENLRKPETGEESYYLLQFHGGPAGISTSEGSYLKEDIGLFLCVR